MRSHSIQAVSTVQLDIFQEGHGSHEGVNGADVKGAAPADGEQKKQESGDEEPA